MIIYGDKLFTKVEWYICSLFFCSTGILITDFIFRWFIPDSPPGLFKFIFILAVTVFGSFIVLKKHGFLGILTISNGMLFCKGEEKFIENSISLKNDSEFLIEQSFIWKKLTIVNGNNKASFYLHRNLKKMIINEVLINRSNLDEYSKIYNLLRS